MILGGDEIARTQGGNNNAYCQDNEISWFDWEHADRDLLAFATQAIAFRKAHPAFRRRRWFKGRPIRGKGASDVAWLKPDAAEMSDSDWNEWFAKSFTMFLNGDGLAPDERGRRVKDTSFLLLFNAHTEAVTFTLPGKPFGTRWRPALDTAAAGDAQAGDALDAGATLERPGLSLLALERV
jgi:glycogen operon protein